VKGRSVSGQIVNRSQICVGSRLANVESYEAGSRIIVINLRLIP
jgi:hypothetical protein